MRILFIHQNFPAQFVHLAPAMAARGHEVVAIGSSRPQVPMAGVRYLQHQPVPPAAGGGVRDANWEEWATKLARGHSCAVVMEQLKAEGFTPDTVFAHPGWGEALYVKDVFPRCQLLIYGEYYYGTPGGDSFFDPEFSRPPNLAGHERLRVKNTHLLHALAVADEGLSPTHFQRGRHPAWFQPRLRVVHDGIDTEHFRPHPAARIGLRSAAVELSAEDEVVTFVARQLEPYRGYHIFMRALPLLLKRRPRARVIIVGGDGVSYGAAPPKGTTWKETFLTEVRAELDMSRVHFVGTVPHEVLRRLFQVSSAHVYLTYPFVLSWSLLEAMSIGCLVVGSRTAPLEEVIQDGRNGWLVDFFDPTALAQKVAEVLENREDQTKLRAAARETALNYDLKQVCLPALARFVEGEEV
jgi:glycosyltransferase involved in cell wall biosynthesis